MTSWRVSNFSVNTWCRKNWSRSEKFSTPFSATFAFGMETTERSNVRRLRALTPMSSTVPVMPAIWQKSPTRTAPRITMDRPPNRSASVFCAARAKAIPPIPKPATKADTFTPACVSSAMIRMMPTRILKSLPSKVTKVARSTCNRTSNR